MAYPTLLQLSPELLQEIVLHVQSCDLATLRRVCWDLNLVASPRYCWCIRLRAPHLRVRNLVEELRSLATGNSPWSRYAHTLSLKPIDKAEQYGPRMKLSDSEAQSLVLATLDATKNIRTIMWDPDPTDPEWLQETIFTFIENSTMIETISFMTTRIANCSILPPVPSLRTLHISHFREPLPPVSSFLKIVRSPALTTLSLHAFPANSRTSPWAQIWVTLRDSAVRLTSVGTDVVTEDLLSYLASYAGIQKLTLTADGSAESAGLADTFFHTVLPQHTESLESLSFRAHYNNRWSFGAHCAPAIPQLRALTNLRVSVTTGAKVDESLEKNDVILLLHTAAQLPVLRELHIDSAYRGQLLRLVKIGEPGGITEWVERFRSAVKSSFIVHALGCAYAMQPVDSEDLNQRSSERMWKYVKMQNQKRGMGGQGF